MAKFISLDNLRQAVNVLLERIAEKVSIDSVAQLLGIKLTAEGSNSQTITTADGRIKITDEETGDEKTVATLEDSTQNINANTVTVSRITTELIEDAAGIVYCFPTSSGQARRIAHNPQTGGGSLVSSFDRTLENTHNILTGETETLDIGTALFNYIVVGESGGTPTNLTVNIRCRVGTVVEFWLVFDLVNAGSVTVNHDWTGITWIGNEPQWTAFNGNRIFVHVIGGYATWFVAMSDSSVVQPTEYSNIADRGTLAQAVEESAKDNKKLFQWILDQTDGNGNAVIKPIWHIGNGVFVDAIGYKLT